LTLLLAGVTAARLCHLDILWAEEAYPTAAAIQLLNGRGLYRDIWFDKPPLFALAYTLWGAEIGWPLRIAGALFVWLCCLLAYRFAARLWTPREGLASALLLGFFLTFGIPSAVIALAPDLLMIAPHLAAVYLAWRGKPGWSGFIAGLALLLNPKGAVVLIACLLWTSRRGWPRALVGFALPNALAFAWYGGPYYEQVWQWGFLYSERTFAFANGVTRTLNWAGFHAALLVAAAYYFWKERPYRMLAWLALSFAAVALGWRFFPRYYFALLPVLTLAAARGYVLLGRARVIVLALLLVPLLRFGPRYITLANDLLHQRAHRWSDLALNQDGAAASALIGREGGLLVWGYRPDIFAYTRLPAATRFLDSQPLTGVIADRHLTDATPAAPELAARNRRELINTQPAYIVDGLGPLNPALAITRYPDLADWLKNYHEIGRTQFSIVYRRAP
jgi:hypothetical protein